MYGFSSENVSTISLHDMIINKIIFGEDIELIFPDGFAVTKENENNLTGRHKQTGQASVHLIAGKYIGGKNCDNDNTIEKEVLEFLILELLSFEWDEEKQKLIVFGNAISGKGDVVELNFSCTKIIFSWNGFVKDAWFESFN